MVNSSRAQRNTRRRQPYAWLGAGALGVGLALAGAGTAHADDGVNETASTAAASSARASGNSAAGAAATSTPRSPAATSRSAGPRQSVNDGAGKRAPTAANRSTLAATPRVRSALPVSAASASAGKPSASERAAQVAAPAAPVQNLPTPSATAAVPSEAGDRPLRWTVERAVAAPAPVAARAAVNPAEALNAAVVDWFDSTSAWLATLPRGPLNEWASGALLLVRRSLFNQLPDASPAQLLTNSAGQVSGSIGASDPEGDALNYRLVRAPEFGLVQIAADGTYTYVPGSDYSGSDSFVVGVSDSGFNLLNPFGSRTTDVAVQVPDESLIGPPVGVSRGFNMTNLSGRAVYLAQIFKESGYETRLEVAPPIGFVLQPGDQVHYETTYLYFYTYDTRFVWKTCEDAFCKGAVTPGDQQWTLRLHTWSGQVWDSNGPTTLNCEIGSCSYDQNGTAISNPLGDNGANRAFLLDNPGTVNQLSAGSQADRVAQVLDRMCQSNASASCSFSPKRFEQTQTDWKLAQSFRNATETTVTQALSRNEQTSTQTSLKVAQSAKVSLFKIVEAGISRETTETWTSSKTWQETYTVPIPPGQTGYLYYRDPIKRVTGDFTATIGNTTWNLTDVNFDTPDPDDTRPDGGRAVYEATNSPLAPQL